MTSKMDRFTGEQKACLPISNCGAVLGGEAFLIREGSANILIDSGFGFCAERLVENIKSRLGDERLDYILLTHSHYDHAMGSVAVKRAFPEAQIIGSEYCKTILNKPGARKAMRDMDATASAGYGYRPGEDMTEFLDVDKVIADGEELTLGTHTVVGVALPGHTKCCMGYYLPQEQMLVSCETVGVYVGGLDSTPGCLIGFNKSMESIQKAMSLPLREMLISHNGMLYGEDIKTYLENGMKSAEEIKELILSMLKEGKPGEEIIHAVEERCYSPEIEKFYPRHAFLTNTIAQIKMFAMEFLGYKG